MSQAAITDSSPRQATPSLGDRVAPLVQRLLELYRTDGADAERLLTGFVEGLIAMELPVARATLHLRQLHPEIAARSLIWEQDQGAAREAGHAYGAQTSPIYLNSPVRVVFEEDRWLHCRLDGPEPVLEYEILHELKKAGYSDYVIGPLPISGQLPAGLSLATKRPGGFSPDQLELAKAALPAFAALLAITEERRTAETLLGTYLGRVAGARVLAGKVRRGEGETLHAVLLFADLRGFTRLSETQPLNRVISLLNAYFDALAGPISENKGEILKFIGDGLLAIFPCESASGAVCAATDRAIAAARAGRAAVAKIRLPETAEPMPPLSCGIAVHVGEVMYGNVGAADRLDFTVIGPAVNLVSRIEGLCTQLESPILVSEDIVRASRHDYRSLGRHALKGLSEPVEVFAPLDEA